LGKDTKRLFLAIALSFAVMTAFNWFQAMRNPKPAQQPKPQPETAEKAPPPPAATGPAVPAVPTAPAPPPSAPEETVVLVGNGFEATFSTWGGALKSFTLQDPKFRRGRGDDERAVDLVRIAEGQAYPLSLAIAPEGAKPEELMASARAPMSVSSRDDRSITFTGSVNGAEVRKSFRLTGKPYELALTVEVTGGPGTPVGLLSPSYTPPGGQSGGFFAFFSGPPLDLSQPICRAGESTERYDPKPGKEEQRGAGAAYWTGVDQHYFISAVLPAEPAGTCVLASGPAQGVGVASLALPPEKARKAEFTIYAGPKDLDTLRAYGRAFDTSVNYGTAKYFGVFARGLLYVMRWLHAFVGNWGIAIILLTLLVKIVLFPLTYKQMQSMNEMRKLQPEIEKLKAKYEGDREKLNMAVMGLYREHKVNPLGGCLPMLLQMPIWFALYAALQTSVELYREGFLWIRDLTQHDPIFVLPLLMGASSFVMQKLSPQPAENAQAKMMLYFFPIFFTFIMLQVPAGLTLYIVVNNVLSIAQQQGMMKMQGAQLAPAK
jgi:YidC/Oxa1 family membrane protein insertase